jgi:site-specific DNA recombinase
MSNPPTPKRAILLARISDAEPGETAGVDDQVTDLRKFAAGNGWTVDEDHILIENDTSAFKKRKITLPDGRTAYRVVRPKFRHALDLLATGRADVLAAIDLDRAMRDPRDLEDLIDVVDADPSRIEARSKTGTLNLGNGQDPTTARLYVVMANKASRDTARRVSRARQRQAEAGTFGGGRRPFGFEADGVTLNPVEAAEIRTWARRLLADAPATMAHLIRDLVKRDVATVTGAPWNNRTIKQILTNPRASGHAVHNGVIVRRDAFEAIIPDDVRERLIEVFESRPAKAGNAPKWLCSLILRCGACDDGGTMSVRRNARGAYTYACRARGHCTRLAGPVDEYVSRVMIAWLGSDEISALLPVRTGVDVAAMRDRKAALKNQKIKAARMWPDMIDDEQLAAITSKANREIEMIDRKISEGSSGSPLAPFAGTDDAAGVWEGLPLGQQREIVRIFDAGSPITLLPGRDDPAATWADMIGAVKIGDRIMAADAAAA